MFDIQENAPADLAIELGYDGVMFHSDRCREFVTHHTARAMSVLWIARITVAIALVTAARCVHFLVITLEQGDGILDEIKKKPFETICLRLLKTREEHQAESSKFS